MVNYAKQFEGWTGKQRHTFLQNNSLKEIQKAEQSGNLDSYMSNNVDFTGTPGLKSSSDPVVSGSGGSSDIQAGPNQSMTNYNPMNARKRTSTVIDSGWDSAPKPKKKKEKKKQTGLPPIDFSQYRTQNSTIEDIAEKYGFDYSRDYANRQAEAERQAKENAYNDTRRRNETLNQENLQSIENNVVGANDALDRNYFQQYMNQSQAQTNNGLNGGLAADQNLRLSMNRQAEMGDIYRDANLGRMQENNRFTNEDVRLEEAIGLLDQWQKAYSDRLYNERRQQGFDNAMTVDKFKQRDNLALLQAALQHRGQNVDLLTSENQLDEQSRQFDQTYDQRMLGMLLDDQFRNRPYNEQTVNQQVNSLLKMLPYEEMTAFQEGNYDLSLAELLGYTQSGIPTLEREKEEWDQHWDQYKFNNVDATSGAKLMQDNQQFLLGLKQRYDQMEQRDRQFLANLGYKKDMADQDMVQFMANLKQKYAGMSQREQQHLDNLGFRYDSLDQDQSQFEESQKLEIGDRLARMVANGVAPVEAIDSLDKVYGTNISQNQNAIQTASELNTQLAEAKTAQEFVDNFVLGGGQGNKKSDDKEFTLEGNHSFEDITSQSPENLINYKITNPTSTSADKINEWIASKAPKDSPMQGMGKYFIEAASASGLDPVYLVAHAAHETGWGRSNIVNDKGNWFGIAAYDDSPYESAYGYDSLATGIIEGAKWIARNYAQKGQDTLYKMRHSESGTHNYATDPDWHTKIASIIASAG